MVLMNTQRIITQTFGLMIHNSTVLHHMKDLSQFRESHPSEDAALTSLPMKAEQK